MNNKVTNISVLALVLSVFALGVSIYDRFSPGSSSPLGRGMDHYDFTTPEKALRSILEAELNQDWNTFHELAHTVRGEELQQKLDTLTVDRVREYAGKKILFIKWEEDDQERYGTTAFEKHAESGVWEKVHLGYYSVEDEILSEEMENWKKRDPKN